MLNTVRLFTCTLGTLCTFFTTYGKLWQGKKKLTMNSEKGRCNLTGANFYNNFNLHI